MSRKPIFGKCRLCGETKKLSFEHVPPETAFNDHSVNVVSSEQVMRQIANPQLLPWDYSKAEKTIQQRGRGGYFLCEDCNSRTGQWYVPEYSKFVHTVNHALLLSKEKEYRAIGIKMKGIRPLPIFKEIMTLFCDINEGLMADDTLQGFLLNKFENQFDRGRYSVYMHIHSGCVERMNGIMIKLVSGIGMITLSEISTYPLGFTLYINMPEKYKPEGVDISMFSQFGYDEESDMEIIIPKLESNILFSGDYRTKDEIIGRK